MYTLAPRIRSGPHQASTAAQPDAVEELPGEHPFPYEKKVSTSATHASPHPLRHNKL